MGWQGLMERSTSNFTYQAWRHEPEVKFDFPLKDRYLVLTVKIFVEFFPDIIWPCLMHYWFFKIALKVYTCLGIVIVYRT